MSDVLEFHKRMEPHNSLRPSGCKPRSAQPGSHKSDLPSKVDRQDLAYRACHPKADGQTPRTL